MGSFQPNTGAFQLNAGASQSNAGAFSYVHQVEGLTVKGITTRLPTDSLHHWNTTRCPTTRLLYYCTTRLLDYSTTRLLNNQVEGLTVKGIIGALKQGELRAEAGRDYSKLWLREEVLH